MFTYIWVVWKNFFFMFSLYLNSCKIYLFKVAVIVLRYIVLINKKNFKLKKKIMQKQLSQNILPLTVRKQHIRPLPSLKKIENLICSGKEIAVSRNYLN